MKIEIEITDIDAENREAKITVDGHPLPKREAEILLEDMAMQESDGTLVLVDAASPTPIPA